MSAIYAFARQGSENYKAECLAEFDGDVTVTDIYGGVYTVPANGVSRTPDNERVLNVAPANEAPIWLFVEDIASIEGELA